MKEVFNEEIFLLNYNEAVSQLDEVEELAKKINEKEYSKAFFVGSGGAYTKFVNMRPILFDTLDIPFIISSPEEMLSLYIDIIDDSSLLIFGSKTGETIELIKLLNELKDLNKNPQMIGFIGDKNTFIDNNFNFLRLNSVDTDVHLIVLGYLLVVMNKKIEDKDKSLIKKELIEVKKGIVERLSNEKENLLNQIEKTDPKSSQMWIGSGSLWGEICCYSNYILEEIQWIFTQPIHSSEFFHGPFELVDNDFVPNLVLNTDENREQDLRVKKFIDDFNKEYILIDMQDYLLEYENKITKKIVEPYILNHIFDTMLNIYTNITGKSIKTRRYYRKIDY